jgi:hypothetical protein
MYVFEKWGLLFDEGRGSVFLWRLYVSCTVVLARGYLRCHGVQVTMAFVHPLSWHYAK